MARTINPAEFAAKRNEILDATQRLVFTKGYERMTIGDILAELKISSGAFYHYFDSKPALLEAFISRILAESGEPLRVLVADPQRTALQKLNGFFAALDELRLARKGIVVEFLRVWYTDHNAVVRQKVDEAVLRERAPLVTAIVQQGLREGVFTASFPEHAGEVVLALVQQMGTTHARLFLALDQERNEARCVASIVGTHAAYMEAIERLLGAPPGALERADPSVIKAWIAALRPQA